MGGATAGVVQQGEQAVFASSTAPKAGKRSSSRAAAPAASERTAAADLWSGVKSGDGPSLASASGIEGDTNGLSGGLVAAMAILGLGLAFATGGMLVVGARRRRAEAGAAASKR